MQNLHIQFEYSPWFILLCLLAGTLAAVLLYQRKGPWPVSVRWILTGLRFLTVSLLCFLLLGPIVQYIRNTLEKPRLIFAVDNSESVARQLSDQQTDSLEFFLRSLAQKASAEYEVAMETFSGVLSPRDSLRFTGRSSDLNGLLQQIESDYENASVNEVILVSDGIFNLGANPLYSQFPFPVSVLGVGDTIQKNDLQLRNVFFNQIAYQGNLFPVVVQVNQHGYPQGNITVRIRHNEKELDRKTLELVPGKSLYETQFLIEASESGLQHFVVEVLEKEGEASLDNNKKHIYIDIIESKLQVVVAAASPHPDIKAIRAALESNRNYEIGLLIPGITNEIPDIPDVLILHNYPGKGKALPQEVDNWMRAGVPFWVIAGTGSDLSALSNYVQGFSIKILNTSRDQAIPYINPNFRAFTLPEEAPGVISDYPPVETPFGEVTLPGTASILFYQQIGQVKSSRPLLFIDETQRQKLGVILGENFWKWRIQEFAEYGSQQVFDAWVSKLIQFLSTQEDRRKFKAYPVADRFTDNEAVIFQIEAYNDIYERIYGQTVDVTLTSEQGEALQFSFTTSQSNSRFSLGALPAGIYRYRAETELDGKRIFDQGEFTVEALQLENIQLTANFTLLRELARRNGGNFYSHANRGALANRILEQVPPGKLRSDLDLAEIIQMPWLFFLLLCLLSGEWVIRKYYGSY